MRVLILLTVVLMIALESSSIKCYQSKSSDNKRVVKDNATCTYEYQIFKSSKIGGGWKVKGSGDSDKAYCDKCTGNFPYQATQVEIFIQEDNNEESMLRLN